MPAMNSTRAKKTVVRTYLSEVSQASPPACDAFSARASSAAAVASAGCRYSGM